MRVTVADGHSHTKPFAWSGNSSLFGVCAPPPTYAEERAVSSVDVRSGRCSGLVLSHQMSPAGRRCPPHPQIGSNAEISQRPPTLSRVTLTLEAVSVGAPLPIVTFWLT